MSKKRNSKKSRHRGRSSTLSEHRKKGKLLRPPMLAAMGDLYHPVLWARDVLPDFIWLCSMLGNGESKDLIRVVKLLDRIEECLGADRSDFPSNWLLTGRLSDFEAIPARARIGLIACLQGSGDLNLVVPEGIVHALGVYSDTPGRWLIETRLTQGIIVDPTKAEEHLSRVIDLSRHGQSKVATKAKMIDFRQRIKAGKISFPASIHDKFSFILNYPFHTTEDQNQLLESFARATFLASAGSGFPESSNVEWCKNFWRENWNLFRCVWPESPTLPKLDSNDHKEMEAKFDEVKSSVLSMWEEFQSVANSVDPNIYQPDRHEVLTGIIGRVLRYLLVFIRLPTLWSIEHGAPLLRALVETQILHRYLILKDGTAVGLVDSKL
jgi:hypothetical protein